MVDHPKTNSLNRSKFFTAVRLIQLFQNGQKVTGPGLQSVGSIMRPPFFEGITGVSATPFEIPVTTSAASSPPPSFGSAPGSPRRDSAVSTTAEVHNTALTHDPYLMLPGEKIRYESLFPQYAQQDDFVYGAKAVELFTKSGLSKEVLRDIWNLVDNPVDNRLDVLEFVIAMHLIVCVSKKNLPLPKTLPFSLKALKDREAAAVAAAAAQQSSLNAVSPSRMSPPQGSLLQSSVQHVKSTSPSLGAAGPTATAHHVRATSQGTISGIQSTFSYGSVSLGGGAPGVVATAAPTGVPMPLGGGASAIGNISEAFEGLGPKMPVSEQNPPSLSSPSIEPYSAAAAATATTTTHTTTTMTHSKEELDKVKAVLQKLQAENVSLKAQLGQYSEEEKSIRDEIAKTVSEIDTLSHDLTLLRSQVVEAKGNLIEASAELKAQVEKRE
jgi:Chromosome segregation ATPases